MAEVFLSYSSHDRVKAQLFAELLTGKCKISVFFDRSSIPVGREWRNCIDEKLQEARAVVVLWSSHAIKSKWVIHEASVGLSRRILVPGIIEDGISIPEQFSSIQTADLTYSTFSDSDVEVDNLLLALGEALGRAISRKHGRRANSLEEANPLDQNITLVPEAWLRFTDTKILLFFLHQSLITSSLVGGILNITVNEAQHHLDRLERLGYIERSLSGPELIQRIILASTESSARVRSQERVTGEPLQEDCTTEAKREQLYAITDKGRQWIQRSVMNR